MRRLMLLRHAKTEADAPSGRDQDRRLDKRGHKDAAEIGSWIGRHPPFPDLVLVSHAIRAHQTWEVTWEAMKDLAPKPQVELMPELYGADPTQLLQIIHEASAANPKRLMLIGHNPGMHELALTLADSDASASHEAFAENLPTSGFAVFDFMIDDWADVAFRRGRLVLFVSPKVLKQNSKDGG